MSNKCNQSGKLACGAGNAVYLQPFLGVSHLSSFHLQLCQNYPKRLGSVPELLPDIVQVICLHLQQRYTKRHLSDTHYLCVFHTKADKLRLNNVVA